MNRKIFSLGILIILLLNACEDLDREVITGLTEQQVTEGYDYTERRANAIYEGLPRGFNQIDNAMMACATDEAEFTLPTSEIQKFNTGSWNEIDNPDNAWGKYYKAIFNANRFLETSDNVNLDVYKLDPSPSAQIIYLDRLTKIERWKSEAIFLRAFFYFELLKRYGGVPILISTYTIDENYENIKRASLDECIQFIIDECYIAASGLPNKYFSYDFGRVTKGAALALKSRVLLYAASDLFNDPSWAGAYSSPELIASLNNGAAARDTKWKAAADAAKAVIDLNEYSLESSYSSLFNTILLSEIILASRDASRNDFERTSYPVGYDLGESGTTPSQNMVDAYEMLDGSKFNWNNPAHAASPYENRDPRLNLSILTNNTMFKDRPVECWTGGLDGKGTDRSTRTGYYIKKYVNPDLDLLQSYTSVHSWILIRLAEIYLNYAEALNEYSPGHPDIKIYVDAVRGRSGINMPPLSSGLSQSEMRNKIRNERRIELAFEGHRFWDVRRWMQAPEYFGAPLKGVEITIIDENTFDYKEIVVENRVWDPKMYLYPIPQSELLKMKNWTQNPLW